MKKLLALMLIALLALVAVPFSVMAQDGTATPEPTEEVTEEATPEETDEATEEATPEATDEMDMDEDMDMEAEMEETEDPTIYVTALGGAPVGAALGEILELGGYSEIEIGDTVVLYGTECENIGVYKVSDRGTQQKYVGYEDLGGNFFCNEETLVINTVGAGDYIVYLFSGPEAFEAAEEEIFDPAPFEVTLEITPEGDDMDMEMEETDEVDAEETEEGDDDTEATEEATEEGDDDAEATEEATEEGDEDES